MIRIYRALAWLRWRTLINTMRGGRQRGGGERFSRILHLAVPILLTLLVIPSSLGMGVLAGASGWLIAAGKLDPERVVFMVRLLLFMITVLVVVWPLVRASQGANNDMSRLILLPIPRSALHLGELVSGLVDPWIVAFLPALFLLPLGLVAGGMIAAGLLTLAGSIAFLFLLTSLGAFSSFLVQLVLRDRKRAERLALVVLVVLTVGGFAPVLLMPEGEFMGSEEAEEAAGEEAAAAPEAGGPPVDDGSLPSGTVETSAEQEDGEAGAGTASPVSGEPAGLTVDVDARREEIASNIAKMEDDLAETLRKAEEFQKALVWLRPLPSELYGASLRSATTGGNAAAALTLFFVLLEGAAVYGGSRSIYRRLLETPESMSRSRSGPRRKVALHRLPGLSNAASAVAMAQYRTFLRTVKGKLSFFLAPVNVMLVGLLLFRQVKQIEALPMDRASLLAYLAVAFSLFGVHPVLLNMYATDRSGLTAQFLAPVSDRDLVRGKLAGGALLASLPTFTGGVAALLISRGGSPFLWLAALLGGVSAYLLFAPVAAFLSALLPKESDLSSLGSAGNPHAAAGIVGFFLTVLALAPPAGLTVIGLMAFDSAPIALALVAAWALLTLGIAWFVSGLAATALGERRENLALVAQGR